MLLSIQLNTNRPDAIKEFVNNVENTSYNPSDIEILVNIDTDDIACKNAIELLQVTTKTKLRFIQTDIIKSYKDLWKPLNVLLQHTDPSVYFITNFSDEFRFKTQGWDEVLKKYINYYEDDIFRIRLSRYRYRNYVDFWECIYAPDSLAIYTKKWMDIVGTWCPCLGPDSWQQLVAFYLANARKFDHIQYDRDISEAFIAFEGEGASIGLTGFAARKRIKDNVDLWFETVSHEMQEKANYAAALLQANIIIHKNSDNPKLSRNFISNRKPAIFSNKEPSQINFKNNPDKKRIEFFYEDTLIYKITYSLSKLKLFFINNLRKPNYGYYAGGGEECRRKDIISQINVYLRMRRYGIFDSRIIIKKPKFLKKTKLGFLWTPFKIILLSAFLVKNLFFKTTGTKKYFRLLSFKINNFQNSSSKPRSKTAHFKKNKTIFLGKGFINLAIFLILPFQKLKKLLRKHKKSKLFKENKIGFLWVPCKIIKILLDVIKSTFQKR